MAFSYACLILQRVVIPLVLVLSALYRPVGISFVYLLMFFISPFVPVATNRNFKGSVTAYFLILIAISTLLILSHIGLQISIILIGFDNFIGKKTFTEHLLRHIGFINFDDIKIVAVVEWVAPEVIVFVTSIASYFALKKIALQSPALQQAENGESPNHNGAEAIEEGRPSDASKNLNRIIIPNFDAVMKISPFFCLATLFFAAVLRPSVPGGFYFLVFLLSGSYWATFKPLQRGFALSMRFVMVVLVIHIIAIVSYQTPWPQQHIPNDTLTARLIGLEPLVISSDETDIRIIFFDTWFKLDSFLSPIAILFSYYALALTSKNLINKKNVSKPLGAFGHLENGTKINRQVSVMVPSTRANKKDSWTKSQRLNVSIHRDRSTEPTETTPLVRHNTRRKSERRSESGIGANDITLDSLDGRTTEDDSGSSLFDQIYYGIVSVGGFIYQNSYIFTNILMMAWSIVYHSWLTFFLLISANVLWMIPNQRKAMMRSSPFIVLYAELLLIAQYIYGMNLTNDELPSKVNVSTNTTGINLEQIGLTRPTENQMQPCTPLIVKTLFLLMFWVTLRQFFKEKSEKRRSSTLADFVAPLQLTVGATTSLAPRGDGKKTSKFLKKTGDIIKNLLVRLWIWLLIFVIFLCAITGKQMTGFRICYMALFLFFLLVFQSSSKAWVKVMYGFWLFLIFYAMSILTLIYTYQFDKFDDYWNDYLNISKTLQKDIGLEKYETKDLFLHLVSPTIIVILTVIQVHYFHKRFVASLQQVSNVTHIRGDESQPTGAAITDSANGNETARTADLGETKCGDSKFDSIKDISRRFFKEFKFRTKNLAKNFKGVFWRFLELHLIKAVYLTAFLCCVSEVCVLHILFAILCVVGIVSKSKAQIFMSRTISLVVSVIILTKMIYQVGYLNHERYSVSCDGNQTNTSTNNAAWFGLEKTTPDRDLVHLVKKYIIYMVMVTLHAVVSLRQNQMRNQQGLPDDKPPNVLFPNVVRADAEKNLEGLVKYLFNFGYYKFGVEITLIALVALITYRQDMVAILYVFWLCLLLSLERSTCAKIWGVFQCFTATLIIVQYIVLVGLPPGLCVDYPWKDSPYSKSLQIWAMIPGNLHYSHVHKLIFDFILLVFINRQKRVFNIEKRHDTDGNYSGGTNKSVIHDIENLGVTPFENPTSDFLSSIRNWCDIFKIFVLCGFYWVTLAVVFLAGTYIVDLFAIGYLIGSFIFLWQGSDFYLRPIRTILKRWNILIFYNVLNITIKTCLQIGGCLFMQSLQTNCGWLVHILGISCAQTIGKSAIVEDDKTSLPKSPAVLVWDTVSFAFLIFQLRIFKSHYFCHIINDTKANSILASRGAEIIEDLRQKQIEHRKKHEQEVLRKIKRKMEKIRATQQKMLRPLDKPTHFDEFGNAAQLARSNSFSSCQGSGYHTPIEDEDNERDEFESEYTGLLRHPDHQNHVRSPSSGAMTISLEGYLEPNRISLGSPHESELPKRCGDDEESVFSPVGPNDISTQANNLLPPVRSSGGASTSPNLQHRQHRRQSSVNTVSWNEPVSETCIEKKEKPMPTDNGADESETVAMRQKSLHRRHLSMGNATYSLDETAQRRRRYSNLSWAREESFSSSVRPCSWGPIGNMYYMESLSLDVSQATCHAESIRAGDYYMFEDMDEKFELDLIDDEVDFLEEQGKISESERKLTRRKTLFEVYKDIEKAKWNALVARRSFASAPGSRIGIKNDDGSTLSEPLTKNYPSAGVAEQKVEKPSTSQDVPDEPSAAKPPHADPDSTDATDAEEVNPIFRLWEAFLVTIAVRLNRLSRNYRYVMKILAEEKKSLKESKGFDRFGRGGVGNVWKPFVYLRKQIMSEDDETSNSNAHKNSQSDTNKHNSNTDEIVDIIDTQLAPVQSTPRRDPGSQSQGSLSRGSGRRSSFVPEIRVMAPSLERGLDDSGTNSRQWSYENIDSTGDFTFEEDFAAKNHHIILEVLISAWYAILSNTDIICYIVVFINQVVNASIISLPLPLMVFLWGTLSLPRPTKTFWVTLIAYTQSLVLIKCIFQFKLIWSEYVNMPNQPLSAAKIIGVELQPHYANYDLLLLLVLFFHRFVLKSQGLWKAQYKEEYIQEGSYVLKDEAPETDDISSDKSVEETAVIHKGNDTLVLGRQEPIVDDDQINVHVNNTMDDAENYIPRIAQLTSTKYLSSTRNFFFNLVHKSRLPTDVYALMFICDFINFFVLLFGFTAFGSQQGDGDGGVQTYLEENKVPIPFLIMLLVQFILIVIDRALYLRKALVHKIVFHFFSVIGIHIWMFFVIPAVTERSFYSLAPPIIFYIIKCLYLLLSSYQIKCGYPKRILGNFLTKGFSLVNMIAFKVYMLTPFVYELRTILDWVCTDTTMTLFDWLKMEDIFSEIYFIKCGRQMEQDFPAMRAQKKKMLAKIMLGGAIILVIVVSIWGPLCLFALGNAVGQSNIPYEVTASLRIGPYDPIYQADNHESIYRFDKSMMSDLQGAYIKKKHAITFITGYDEDDVAAIVFAANSPTLWGISPPDRMRLLNDLVTNKTLTCRFSYSFSRTPPTKGSSATVSAEATYNINGSFPGREAMISMLQGTATENDVFIIPQLMPKFIKVLNSGDLNVGTPLMPSKDELYRPLELKLRSDDNKTSLWWELRENCNDTFYKSTLSHLPYSNCTNGGIVMYTFNDKKFPSTFSFLTAGGIIGLYTTFVLLASRFLKSFMSGQSRRIMFEDLPYVDRVLQLCLDIYLVREALELALEEDLFAKLIFLYRSPETMVKWTRPKEETNDDETDTESVRSRGSSRRHAHDQ